MKKRILFSIVVVLALLTIFSTVVLAADNVLLDGVDFGSAGTEGGHNLVGWGRSVTDETGGNYGGIGLGGCRLVWDGETDGPDAEFTFLLSGGSAETLIIQHLDGRTDDSFNVGVKDDSGNWVSVGIYRDTYTSPETWLTTLFFLSSLGLGPQEYLEFKIEATGPKWDEFSTWGQLCIDRAELYGTEGPPEEEKFCDEGWKPPINLPKHTVNVQSTLPIKFWLADCEGNPLPPEAEPQLVVKFLGNDDEDGGEKYEPSLKRGTGGYQFIALFRPEKHGEYEAVLTYEGEEWKQEFVVVEHGNGKDKSQAEDKLTGKDKDKPGKPESEPRDSKPKGKPEGKPGKEKKPKKP